MRLLVLSACLLLTLTPAAISQNPRPTTLYPSSVRFQTGLRPPLGLFRQDSATWRASEILKVDGPALAKGEVIVLETWRGRIPPGSRFDFPHLDAPMDTGPVRPVIASSGRAIRRLGEEPAKPRPPWADHQVVLFLMEGPLGQTVIDAMPPGQFPSGTKSDEDTAPSILRIGPTALSVRPVNGIHWHASLGWIEDGDFQSALGAAQDLSTLREAILALDTSHLLAQRALGLKDPAQRALLLGSSLLRAPYNAVLRADLIAALVACGRPAVGVLEPFLSAPDLRVQAAAALARIGDPQAHQALLENLRTEVTAWRESPPAVANHPRARTELMRRIDRLEAAILAIRPLPRLGEAAGLLHELEDRLETRAFDSALARVREEVGRLLQKP